MTRTWLFPVFQHTAGYLPHCWNDGSSEIEEALWFLRHFAEIVPVTVEVSGIASHPEDDMVIATAVSAEVEYLVTGDKELQGIRSYGGVRILSPREFLAILDNQREEPGLPTQAPQP